MMSTKSDGNGAVITRFAPSPTGYLHIGGARTALFNWLYAKHFGGRFLLRIEDTDRKRSTQEAVDAIKDGLRWMGLDWDGEAVSQFGRAPRHMEVAEALLAKGKAYRCYLSPEELQEMRDKSRAAKQSKAVISPWRDRDPSEAPAGVDPVIRLRASHEGETVVQDAIQGEVKVANDQMDDMVLLRADGTPTYMLAVVVDDHDMGITHVIRGDDHLTNTFRQMQIYDALGWELPVFAHQALMHGNDGAKLSKRHGAVGLGQYRDQGFLPEALRNYLLRIGWGHGDDEIISTEQAIEWFDLDGVGKSAARFDMDKLSNLNGHYIREADDARLVSLVLPRLEDMLDGALAAEAAERLSRGITSLKDRAKTIVELSENAAFYVRERPVPVNDKAAKLLDKDGARDLLARFCGKLTSAGDWTEETLDAISRDFAEAEDVKLGRIAQPLRAALTGSNASPGIFEVMVVLGREESFGRIGDALAHTD